MVGERRFARGWIDWAPRVKTRSSQAFRPQPAVPAPPANGQQQKAKIIVRFAIPPRLLAIKEFETITSRMTLSKHGMLQDFLPFSPTVPLPLKATF
jgi:hypothetical protein